eukprot:6820672-Prymnesium_polylepis.1
MSRRRATRQPLARQREPRHLRMPQRRRRILAKRRRATARPAARRRAEGWRVLAAGAQRTA